MAAIPPVCDFDWLAPDFNLIGVDQKKYNLDSVKGRNGTLIMFICNHCPYVKSILEQLVVEVSVMQKKGIGCVAINSNDYNQYPDDKRVIWILIIIIGVYSNTADSLFLHNAYFNN